MTDHDSLLLSAADALAAWLHRDDVDKQGEPLTGHCRRVAATLREQGRPVEVVAAGLLHEVGEDVGWEALDAVLVLLGVTVYRHVDHMTRRTAHRYHEDYIERIAEAGPEAVAIKLADLRDNLDPSRPIPDSLRKRYEKAVARLEAVECEQP